MSTNLDARVVTTVPNLYTDVMSTDTTMTIPTWVLPVVQAKQAKLTKLAAKLGVEAPVLTVGPKYQGLVPARFLTAREADLIDLLGASVHPVATLVDVTTSGATPVLPGGYRVLATVEHHAGPEGNLNLVACSPRGSERGLALALLNAEPTCDHCGLDRNRKATIVVEAENGNVSRVGSTCLADFLGFHAGSLDGLWRLMADTDADLDSDAVSSARSDLDPFIGVLTLACAAIREHGFTSAQAEFAYSTKARVLDHAYGTAKDRTEAAITPTEADAVEANAILAWLTASTEVSDYMVNLSTLALLGYVPRKFYGLAVSAPQAYHRHLGKVAERAARDAQQAEAGPAPLGKGIVIEGIVVAKGTKDNAYGTRYVMTVMLDNGAKVWGTEPKSIDPEVGERVRFTATVEPSDKPSFAFFSRPTKAQVLATA